MMKEMNANNINLESKNEVRKILQIKRGADNIIGFYDHLPM